MLFIYDAPSALVFWMKNTLIPLDMIFIGSDRRIVGHRRERRAADRDRARRSTGSSQYVLEIGGGLSAQARDPRWAAGRFPGQSPRQ